MAQANKAHTHTGRKTTTRSKPSKVGKGSGERVMKQRNMGRRSKPATMESETVTDGPMAN